MTTEKLEINVEGMEDMQAGFELACFVLEHGDMDDFTEFLKKESDCLARSYRQKPYEHTRIERDGDNQVTGARKEMVYPLTESIARIFGIAKGAAHMQQRMKKQLLVHEIASKIIEITAVLDAETEGRTESDQTTPKE